MRGALEPEGTRVVIDQGPEGSVQLRNNWL